MLTPSSLTARVIFSICWMGLCMLWSASVTGDYWLLFLALIVPGILLCTSSVWKAFSFMIDLAKALFASPDQPEVERTVDGFHAALKWCNNWGSRNTAAAIALGSMFLMLITKLDLPIFLVGGAATVIATHFPLILNRFMASKEPVQMFNAGPAE